MTHRLLEGEVRAASITVSAPLPRFSTQASNFSLRIRSAAFADITTVSIPNCRKHSASKVRAESFRSTRAARAATFLMGEAEGRIGAKAFSMGRIGLTVKPYSGLGDGRFKDTKD